MSDILFTTVSCPAAPWVYMRPFVPKHPGMKHSAYTSKTPQNLIYTLTLSSGLADMCPSSVPNPNVTLPWQASKQLKYVVMCTRHVVSYPNQPHRKKSDLQTWFHFECVGISKEILKDKNSKPVYSYSVIFSMCTGTDST